MRLIIGFFILTTLVFFSCKNESDGKLSTDLINNPNSAEGSTDDSDLPKIKFKRTEHDFGKIVDGVKVTIKFPFTNVGKKDLIIMQVKASCGCTATRYTKEVVKPGKSGFVELTFDSSRRRGFNNKTAMVVHNGQPNTTVLKITAEVLGPENL